MDSVETASDHWATSGSTGVYTFRVALLDAGAHGYAYAPGASNAIQVCTSDLD